MKAASDVLADIRFNDCISNALKLEFQALGVNPKPKLVPSKIKFAEPANAPALLY